MKGVARMEQGMTGILQLFGGLALFLYGMEQMSDALRTAAGDGLKRALERVTGSPLRGVLTGFLVTALLQSSSAVTVILIGFVSAGLMELRQAIPVVFGSNIGTTITAQLLAFSLDELRYAFLIAGVLLCFALPEGKLRQAAIALVGFSLLLEGIFVMGAAVEPLLKGSMLSALLQRVGDEPLLGLLTGLGMTLTVQSSSATIAVLQRVAAMPAADGVHSILGLSGALPVLLGDNIGTTITAVLASVPGSRDAKRLAAAHALFNLSGAVLFLCFLPQYAQAVAWLSPKGAELAVIARQIANAHTLFNLCCTALWLPFTGQMEALVRLLVPEKKTR